MASAIFVTLTLVMLLCSDVLATQHRRHTDALNNTHADVQADDSSHHEDVGHLEGRGLVERLKRQNPTRLDDININVNATDNSCRGGGSGSEGSAHRERPGAERLTPVRATDARRKPNTIGSGEEIGSNRRLAPGSTGRRQHRY